MSYQRAIVADVDVELRHLRMVRTIARVGTATAAAGEIGVTQSALSQQLLDLESRLGERLFARTGRRMVPTAFGETFLARAEAVLDESSRLHGWLVGRKLGERELLRLSSDNVLSLHWLPRVLGRFRELHPGVGLRILRTANPMRELVAGRLDLAITYPQDPAHPRIAMVPLLEDEMVAVLPPRHPLARKRFLAPEDLAGQDFLYHMDVRSSALFRRFLEPRGVRLGSATVIEYPEAILELVRAGLGVSLLPRASVAGEHGPDAVVLRPLGARRGGYRIAWSAAFHRDRGSPWIDEAVRLIRSTGTAAAQTRP
ncbi:MAG TPA: LysR family transcriptional regulator [Candidatus Binatia bacterium]|jgi:LysR family transcriptional regulator for metE and metH